MTTEEKLIHFQEDAMLTARKQSSTELDAFTKNLDRLYEEHCQSAKLSADNQLKLSKEALHREHNRQLSKKQLETKRRLALTRDAHTEALYNLVLEMISEYKKTPKYLEALVKNVEEAKKTAGSESLIVFIDKTDEALLEALSKKTGVPVDLSKEDILGGIEAVMPDRKILIDMSFSQKLLETKNNLKLGGENDE